MKTAQITDPGLIREKNEDYLYADESENLFIIADGMGGYAGGEVASSTAVNAFIDYFKANQERYHPFEVIKSAFEWANNCLLKAAKADKELKNMGTTMTVVFVDKEHAYIGHIGDSRCYYYKDNELRLLTSDHNIPGELLKNGSITPTEAEKHPQKNILTRALGDAEELKLDLIELKIAPGDKFFLGTDGMTDLVSEAEISDFISNYFLEEALKKMLSLALARGGHDNITGLLVEME